VKKKAKKAKKKLYDEIVFGEVSNSIYVNNSLYLRRKDA